MCGRRERRGWFPHINPSWPLILSPLFFSSFFLIFFFTFLVVLASSWIRSSFFFPFLSLHLCLSPFSFQHFVSLLQGDEFIALALLRASLLSSLPLSDFQSRFIRFSGLAFFLQHTPLPPKLIGFHYGQGWSAHTAARTQTHTHTHARCALSHWGPTPIPTSICLRSLASISISGHPPFQSVFFLFLCYHSTSIHPFPLQSAQGWNKVVSRALCVSECAADLRCQPCLYNLLLKRHFFLPRRVSHMSACIVTRTWASAAP